MRKEISIGKNSKGVYTKTPTEGRSYRNNKIVDMTYEVLTHETTADKILNPGGFTQQKLMGYKVEAYRNNPNLSWEQIDNMELEDLKKLSYTDKNLTFIDTHLDFYKQNSAAASLIGIFAVANISHMILQDNGLRLDVESLLRGISLDIIGLKIEGSMEIDSRFNSNKESVSKILGSLVASSADAVKDPVLNLMNINISTVNVLNSLIRLGMPFEKAAMFLSQKCITDILFEYNKQNLNGNTSLSQVLSSRLDKMKKEFGVEASNELFKEPIEEEDVVRGLRETTPEMEFKTLHALNHLLNISKEIGSLSLATRFNSMTSAVGPLIIDNLITENKWDDFSNYITDINGNKIIMEDIFNMHPILKQFARTYGIANYIFRDFPINGYGFRNLLNSLTDNLSIINKDRKLISKLGDFYLSYLLIQNDVVKSEYLDYYINQFPKDFFDGKTKEEYPDNPFIQAIRLEVDKSSGLSSLTINTTGMRQEDKEILSSGWYDLYKDNEDLAMNLFEYCFFKGGIGFTPKTFMHLLPMQMREKIEGYIDTYNKVPSVISDIVIDQFVRNNAVNNRLVPIIDKDAILEFTTETIFKVADEDTIMKMKGQLYVKTNKKPFKMYKQTAKSKDNDFLIYEEVSILGSNGAYLEMNTSDIDEALISKLDTLEDNDSDATNSISEPSNTQVNSNEDQEILEILYKVLEGARDVNSREKAIAKHKKYSEMSKSEQKSMEKTMKNWMAKTMERLGLEHNNEQVDKIYNRMCK